MPRRLWPSLDGPYVAPRPGDTVDLRGTTTRRSVDERKEILLSNYYAGIGSYFGGYSSVTSLPGRPWNIERGVREGYGRVVWVYRAVRVIAVSQSRLRFGVKDSDKPIGRGASEVDDPILPLLNVRANPVEFAFQLRERVSTQWMLSPRGGFLETVPFQRRRGIAELRLLPPHRTRIVPDAGGNIDHFEVDPLGGIGKPRTVAPELVRWFREPHPLDPFAGMTPLEAAGLSVEMDHFARLYNRQTMANVGRPAGIVGITSPDGKGEPADDKELDRVERKFGGGPVDAGRIVVIDGTVTYTDVARSPRDLQWVQGRTAGRDEIFVAFGVPLSVAGDASGRTFSNAGQEWVDYWVMTGVPHGDGFAWLFHDDVGGVPFLDYSKVEALQEVERTHRAELRDEVAEGTRTPLSYARETGQPIGDGPGEFPDVPATRSLWFPGAGAVPIAATPDDQVEVDKLTPLGGASQAAPMRGAAAGAIEGGAPAADVPAGGFDGGPPYDGTKDRRRGTSLAKLATERAAKSPRLQVVGGSRERRDHGDDDQEDHRAAAAEAALRAQMDALAHRLVEVTIARVQGTKARAGTRHWVPRPGEEPSTKQLDPAGTVDPRQWYDQARQIADQYLAPAARAQYDQTAAEAGAEPDDGGDLAALIGTGVAAAGALALAAATAEVVEWIAVSAANHGTALLEAIRRAETDDAARVAAGGVPDGVAPIIAAVRAWAGGIAGWLDQIVPTSVAQAIEAGKHAALSPLGDRVERIWRTRLDDKVRSAHRDAEGQVAVGGQTFVIGAEALRYPRDPKGSPGNTINCRCRTRWRVRERVQAKAHPDVVADLLALPSPPRRTRPAGVDVPGPGPRLAGRVVATGALAGVGGRDHVREILRG